MLLWSSNNNYKTACRLTTAFVICILALRQFFTEYLVKNRPCLLGSWATESWACKSDWKNGQGEPRCFSLQKISKKTQDWLPTVASITSSHWSGQAQRFLWQLVISGELIKPAQNNYWRYSRYPIPGTTMLRNVKKKALGSTWLTGEEIGRRAPNIWRIGTSTGLWGTDILPTQPHLSSAQTGSTNGGKWGEERKLLPGASKSSKNGVFYKSSYLKYEFLLGMQNWVFLKKR